MTIIEFAKKRLYECDRDGDDIDLRYWAAYLDGARAQKKEDTAWISVEDSLPPLWKLVVVSTDKKDTCVAYRTPWGDNPWCKEYSIRVGNVTHWMAIPKPPEVKGT